MMTIRQELIKHAAAKLRYMRQTPNGWALPHAGGPLACDAIEAIIDGATPGTLGGLMLAYVAQVAQNPLSYKRLECAIERSAK